VQLLVHAVLLPVNGGKHCLLQKKHIRTLKTFD
jgi:hypothetical protein